MSEPKLPRIRYNDRGHFAVQSTSTRWTTFGSDGWPDGTYSDEDVMSWEGWAELGGDPNTPKPMTGLEIVAALREARTGLPGGRDPRATEFLDGYDTAVEQAGRLADYPWHERDGDET